MYYLVFKFGTKHVVTFITCCYHPWMFHLLASYRVVGYYYYEQVMKHYQNFQCYIPEKNGMRDGVTIDFFPKLVQTPKTSSVDWLICKEDIILKMKYWLFSYQGLGSNYQRKNSAIYWRPTPNKYLIIFLRQYQKSLLELSRFSQLPCACARKKQKKN